MTPRLSPGQSLLLYTILLSFIVAIYGLGLFIGKSVYPDARRAYDAERPLTIPDSDIKSQLEFYQQVRMRSPEAERLRRPTGSIPPRPLEPTPAALPPEPHPSLPAESSGPVVERELPSLEVEPVEVEIVEASARGEFTVQVGAMRSVAEAHELQRRLKASGHAARLQDPTPGSDGLFRVWVGDFDSRSEALDLERRLQQEGFPTYVVRTSGGRRTN